MRTLYGGTTTPTPTCEARVTPLRERKMRPCGLPSAGRIGGRDLCSRHLSHAKRIAQAKEKLP
jgi:hypothetical protein